MLCALYNQLNMQLSSCLIRSTTIYSLLEAHFEAFSAIWDIACTIPDKCTKFNDDQKEEDDRRDIQK